MPKGNWFTRVNDYTRPELGHPHKLRLVYTYESITDNESTPLNSHDFNDLRMFLAARTIYALTSPKVAGAITQTNIYDYRYEKPEQWPSRKKGIPRKCAHFGGVVGSCEVWVSDWQEYKPDDKDEPRGQIWVRGPAVAGAGREGREKGVGIGVVGRLRGDGCLEYV